jgi:SAM-dependent methyltransferase
MNFPYEDPVFRRAARQAAGSALRPGGLELTRQALRKCNWPAGCMVIDVGCGSGATLGLLAKFGFTAKGFDLSLPMLMEATANSGCPAAKADAAKLPLADGSVDAVVCECLLSTLAEPDLALAEFYRVLVPGGGLLLADVAGFTPGHSAETGCAAAAETSRQLEKHGFHVRQSMDHPEALKAMAAQIVWLGGELDGFDCRLNFHQAGRSARDRASYCQWIACKPDAHIACRPYSISRETLIYSCAGALPPHAPPAGE